MSTLTNDQIKLTQDWLQGYDYLPVLRAFTQVGVATFPDLQRITGFTTDILKRILERLTQPPPGLGDTPQAVREMPSQTVFQGQRGRHPQIFRLEKLGAALLRKSGDKTAVACALNSPIEIAHALGFRALAAAAQAAKLAVAVDKPLPFGEQRNIRPDVVVTLPDQPKLIFEVEQRLQPQTLDRIVEKVRHLRDFFLSPAAKGYAPEVRVLFNVTDREGEFARKAWGDIIASVTQEHQAPLPCTFWAGVLLSFLEEPAWDTLKAFVPLASPAKPAAGTSGSPGDAAEIQPLTPRDVIPNDLQYRVGVQGQGDRVVLGAYLRVIQSELAQYPDRLDVAFMHLFGFIYGISHKHSPHGYSSGQMPWGSLILLRKYLELPAQRGLRGEILAGLDEVDRALVQGGISMACHYYTKLIWSRFLRYFGMVRGGWLRVWVESPLEQHGNSEMHVYVSIENWGAHSDLDFASADEEGYRMQAALKWVLEALIFYPVELGLG